MEKSIFWIEGPWLGKLAIVLRPQGKEWLEEVSQHWRAAGLDVVISLLTAAEIARLGLEREGEVALAHGIQFLSFPIADFGVPASLPDTQRFVQQITLLLNHGKNIGIHCWGSIGRSSLVSATLLVNSGLPPATAFARIQAARGHPVPETDQQRQWVEDYELVKLSH